MIELKPDYTEAWNRRATLYFLQKDYGHALADIREVLAREPRHFGALSGLGLILQEIGDDKHALEAYRRALAIDPHLEQHRRSRQDAAREGRGPRHLTLAPSGGSRRRHRHCAELDPAIHLCFALNWITGVSALRR